MNDTQTPVEEVQERLAEATPAKFVPMLMGIQNAWQNMADFRARCRDDHRMNTKVLSDMLPDGEQFETTEPEEVGDINVSGDSTKTENHYHYPATSQPAAAGKQEAPSLARKLLPLALAAGLGAGGLWLANNWGNLEWPGVPDTSYEVRFYDADGNLIEVPRHSE